MANVINTNISSLNAQRNLSTSQSSLATSLQRLSTGLRINSAKDDAAGQAISTRMTAQINGMQQASRNANDGISMSQTAEGAMGSINDILLRMRDLSVQASNGTNGTAERATIQNEVDQLYQEIDRISGDANFNGIKLLDGSAKSNSFQVGANTGQTISFGIKEVSTKSMSLNSTTGLGDLNGGRVGTLAPADGDLTINGKSINFNGETSIGGVKDAINAMSSQTGVTAEAYNVVKGEAGASGKTSGLQITVANADGSAGTAVTIDDTANMTELVDKINKQVGGVTASIDKDGALSLTNDTGAAITVGGTATGSGLTAGAAQNGYLSLKSASGEPIALGTANGTAASELNQFGFNASNGNSSVSSSGGVSAASGSLTLAVDDLNATKGAVLADDDVTINGVTLGAAGASAAEKAAAINALQSQTGVKATASTSAFVSIGAIGSAADFSINGNTVAASGVADTDALVAAINEANIPGVKASYDSVNSKLVLTSDSGNDIVVGGDGAFITGVSDNATTTGTAPGTDSVAVRGQITLSSENGEAVKVGGADVAKLGLAAQGGDDSIGGGKLDVSTAKGAQDAIGRIDKAIAYVSEQRANMGAVQNRLSTTVSNLSTATENASAARSRIQDADFATETANMTRGQILQQAGTAMLAQANSLPNGVLSLLRG